MEAYVINLDRRLDRWVDLQESLSRIESGVRRIPAVDARNLDTETLKVPPEVAACWASHQKVSELLLATESSHCLVFEDDIVLTSENIGKINNLMKSNLAGIDLLQIGFSIHSNRLSNRRNFAIQKKAVSKLQDFHLLKKKSIILVLRKFYGYGFEYISSISGVVAQQNFELGTHAYVISRRMAEVVVRFNKPTYLPADLAMMELAQNNEFKTFRVLESFVNQSESPSSISNASNSITENEIKKIENNEI